MTAIRSGEEPDSHKNIAYLAANCAAAERFLTLLDEGASFFTFQTFDDRKGKDRSLARIFHGTLEQHQIDLTRLQARGAGVYATVNCTDGKGRKLDNMQRPRAIWCEWDDGARPLPEWPLDPQLVVETSPHKYHVYWFAQDLGWDDFDALMGVMVAWGSDPNAKDRARVLRVPGFWHQKTTPFQVRIAKENACLPYTRSQLLAAFQPAPKLSVQSHTRSPSDSSDPERPRWQAVVTRLAATHAARTWADPKAGRNAQVMSLGHELEERGVPEEFDPLALTQFGSIMRPTNTSGEETPLNWPNEWAALKHGRRTALQGPTVAHGAQQADHLLKHAATPRMSAVASPILPTLPALLLNPPGALGAFVQWVCQSARFPQPVLALANGLALFGALIGQTARTPTDLRPNLYTLGIAPSATGKDHSRQCAKRLLKAAGLTDRLGGENLASDSGLLEAVHRSPACLFQIDEFGRILKTLGRADKPHLYAIPTTLMQLYSSANSLFLGKEYASGERQDIDQPCACLYGTTVPAHFFAALTHDEAQDGFLARFLVFQGNDDPPEQDALPSPPPDALLAIVAALATRTRNISPHGNIDAIQGINPPVIPFAPAAKVLLDALAKEKTAGRKAQQREGTDALWGRCWEMAVKVALIVAVADGAEVISADHAALGIAVATWCIGTMAAHLATHVAENDTESAGKRVERIIREAGAGGMSMSDLYAKTRFLKKRERSDIVEEMKEAGLILESVASAKEGNPKGVRVLVHAAFANSETA